MTWNEWERLRPGDVVESVIEYGTYRIIGRTTGPTGATAWRAVSEHDRTPRILVAPRDYAPAMRSGSTFRCRARGCTMPIAPEGLRGRDGLYCSWHLSLYNQQRAAAIAQTFAPCAQLSCGAAAQEIGLDGLRYCAAHGDPPGLAPRLEGSEEELEELRAWAEAGLSRAQAIEESLHELGEVVDRLSEENARLRGRLELSPWARELMAEESGIALAKAEAARARAEAEKARARALAAEAQLERLRRAGLELLLARMEDASPYPH